MFYPTASSGTQSRKVTARQAALRLRVFAFLAFPGSATVPVAPVGVPPTESPWRGSTCALACRGRCPRRSHLPFSGTATVPVAHVGVPPAEFAPPHGSIRRAFALHSVNITPFREDITTEIRISRMKCNFDRMNRMNRIEERRGSNGQAGGLSCKSCSTCLPFFLGMRDSDGVQCKEHRDRNLWIFSLRSLRPLAAS